MKRNNIPKSQMSHSLTELCGMWDLSLAFASPRRREVCDSARATDIPFISFIMPCGGSIGRLPNRVPRIVHSWLLLAREFIYSQHSPRSLVDFHTGLE